MPKKKRKQKLSIAGRLAAALDEKRRPGKKRKGKK